MPPADGNTLPRPSFLEQASHLDALTDEQRAQLAASAPLRAEFEAGLEPFLPKPTGVCWAGMTGDTYVPVRAVFDNAVRTVRFAQRRAA